MKKYLNNKYLNSITETKDLYENLYKLKALPMLLKQVHTLARNELTSTVRNCEVEIFFSHWPIVPLRPPEQNFYDYW
jgi:hypothetical protein